MRYNPDGLFPVLEAALKAASEPLDCQTLYDMPEVQQHAASVNRVSDYLGGLWRKGLVVRLPAPKTGSSRARWVYEWKGSKGPKLHTLRTLSMLRESWPTGLRCSSPKRGTSSRWSFRTSSSLYGRNRGISCLH